MKSIFIWSVAAVAAIGGSPALSQSGNLPQVDEIVVEPAPPVDVWVENTSAELNRSLRSIARLTSYPSKLRHGIVRVRFECGEDGRPTNIGILDNSGTRMLGVQAKRAVAGIDSLHPLPRSVTENQLFQANIIFANSRSSYEQLARRLHEEESQRIAASDQERDVLALNLALRTTG